jgi:hypothetical protein
VNIENGRPWRGNTIAIAVVVVAILVVTLSPAGAGERASFSFAFDLGRRGVSDAILNILLFVPLGVAIGWKRNGVIAAGLFGLLLATFIEVAQILLPGRDPALSDIVLNTAGAMAGAVLAQRRRTLLDPDARAAAVLTAAGLLLPASVVIATAYLLSPIPESPARAERTLQLPDSPGESAADVRTLVSAEVAGAVEPVFIARSGNDLLLRYPSRGGAFGFDQPEYWRSGAFENKESGEPTRVSVSRDRSRWDITIGADRATLGPTPGQGWAALAYPDAIGRRWGGFISGLWLLGIFILIGFWARGRLLLVGAVVSGLLLVFLPPITGLVGATALEWAGALIGLSVGALLGFSRRPRRP